MATVTGALDKIYEEGRLQGQTEAQRQFFGKAAAGLTGALFISAMEQAATLLRPHSAETADFFHQEAGRIQAFITPPRIVSHDPDDGATNIVTATPVHVKFAAAIAPDSVTDETVYIGAASGGPHLKATLSYDDRTHTVTLTPESDLSPGVEYRVTIGAVRAAGGMTLDPPVTFSFTTKDG